MTAAIGLTILALLLASYAAGKWLDREHRKFVEWYDSLNPGERRKVQERLYRKHI